jgi:putative tricarboxylic transport membrane protein
MDPQAEFLTSFGMFLEPGFMGLLVGGVALGLVVGAVPGLTATLAIALLLPFTFRLAPAAALVMLTGIYIGGIYGGSITAITIRIPGAPASTMTMLDGNAMARAGRPEAALGLATFSSFVGGISGGVVLTLLAPQLARVALEFQSPEMFSLMFMALVAVATVTRGPLAKGLAATILGLMLSTVGLDKMVPVPRFTLGMTDLLVGVPLMPVVIGLFAVAEFFRQVAEPGITRSDEPSLCVNRILDFWPEVKRTGWRLFGKSAAIGAFVGALPGGGAAMGAFLAYTEAKRSSNRSAEFGTGIAEGIIAPETANNAVTGGALIPMLAFGIPGDAVTAVMLGGLLIQGITPGPQLFREHSDVVMPLFAGYFLAYAVVLVLGFALLPWFARLARADRAWLFPFIAAVSMVAAFASERTMFGMGLTVCFGVAGFLLMRFGFPLVPVLLGYILGPMLEANFRRALIVSEHGLLIFVQSPISAALLVASGLLLWYFGYLQPRRASSLSNI